MNIFKSIVLMEKYANCPKCRNDKIGNGQGGIIVEENTLRRFCKCGFDITIDENGNEEHNHGIGVTRLREDIRKGNLKAYKGSHGYYVVQSDLDKYLNIK